MAEVRSWAGMRVLVTGGAGFLGSHVVTRLVDRGADVACLVRDPPGPLFSSLAGRVSVVRGSILDYGLLAPLAEGADAVLHFAAKPIVGEAKDDPMPAVDVNVRGTLNLLDAVRVSGRPKVLLSCTSDKVYGSAPRLPSVETDPLLGSAPYEASKVCADVLSRCYAESYRLPIAVVRFGNLYGPGDIQWSRLIPGTIRSLLAEEQPVIRSDGKMVRDYLYVEDAAEGCLLLAGSVIDNPEIRGEAWNFGTEVGTSVLDVVKMIVERSRQQLDPVVLGGGAGEIPEQRLDCTKVRSRLGWEARTKLSDGLDKAWDWYSGYLG